MAKDQQERENRSTIPPPKPSTTIGPNATVLKLGSSGPPRMGGLVLKTPSDKPTLVAKPSAPNPVRSPWAQLPPVDKVPPVPINPPNQLIANRQQQIDSHGSDSSPAPLSAAVEIAADSFTRTRRETQNGNHGQLYNSQSGQYEPVNATRRGSIRKEQNFRPPSLLQRPSNNEQNGPAEPSAAFQTHRSGNQQDQGSWNRRASSTVSGDSGSNGRRASMKNFDIPRIPLELLQQRRESQPLQSPSTPGNMQARLSQNENTIAQAQPLQNSTQISAPMSANQISDESAATASPQQSKALPIGISAASHPANDVAAQKQLMREKRELAIKRKKEEEEKEEAGRKERIRLKMEQLGMPPLVEKKEIDKGVVESKSPESRDVDKEKVNTKDEVPKASDLGKPQDNIPRTQEIAAPLSRSPPKPPILDASGTPKQYGLMKVHGPPLSNGIQPIKDRSPENKPKPLVSMQRNTPAVQEPTPIVSEQISQPKVTPPMANGEISKPPSEPPAPESPSSRNQDLFKPRQQPWKPVQNDSETYMGWNGTGMTTHSSPVANLWGPPNSFKSLGNGTFDRNVQRPQSRQPPYQENYLPPPPQPIGPPRHLQRTRESPESLRGSDIVSSLPSVEDSQTIPTFPSSELSVPPMINREITSPLINKEQPMPPQKPSLIHHTNSQMNREQSSRGSEQVRSTIAAWGNFHITSAREEEERRRQAAREHKAQLDEEARTGIRHEPQAPIMNETWRQVKVDDQSSTRQVVGVAKHVHGTLANQPLNGDLQGSLFPGSSNIPTSMGAGRGSRFFPGLGQGIQNQQPRAASYTIGSNRPASPPPPDSSNHPAYIRDQERPLVNLPFLKPKPTVRLPPAAATPLHSPVMTAAQAVPLRAVSQPLVNTSLWQDRINGLLGVKKQSPEKKFAHVADFSSTKLPLEAATIQPSAAVSLPPKEEETMEQKDEEVTTKTIEEEEELFENREFGSLPTVLIPGQVPEALQPSAKLARNGKNQHNRFTHVKEVDAESIKNLEEKENQTAQGIIIFVKMIGMGERKSKTMPRVKSYSSHQGTQRNRHVSTGSKQGKGYKPRESNGNYGSQKMLANGTPRSPMPNSTNPQPRNNFGKHNPNWGSTQRVANAVQ